MRSAIITCIALICAAAAPAFATHSWSGFLVNSDCYEALERNVNPWDTSMHVDRDRDWEIRYCAPNRKTKSFGLVDHDGYIFPLDSAGNARAAEIVQNAATREFLKVVVTGEIEHDKIGVGAISHVK